jgi:galactose mutarotase-like enzyme
MLGASLAHRGEELLGRTDNLERYANEGSTMGIPLLHPWANRLAGSGYSAAGATVELDPDSSLLHLDGNGLPIHGIVGAALSWRVVAETADGDGAVVAAEFDFAAPDLLTIFPFPHRLRQEARLDAGGLTLTTTLAPTADSAVPVSFGYHPYVKLPGVTREGWRVELPPMRRLVLDAKSIPTGAEEPFPGLAGPLDRDYDDGFAGLPERPAFSLAGGGRRIVVTFLEGYPFAQVFAPPGQDFICFEPMTAPTNALQAGAGLRLVRPGERYRAAFRLSVEPAG